MVECIINKNKTLSIWKWWSYYNGPGNIEILFSAY